MTVVETIQSFYDALTQKNDTWQENLSEKIVFSDASKQLYAEEKEAFIQSFTTFLRAVENVRVKQSIVEGDSACAVVGYDYRSPGGSTLQRNDAEVWRMVNGKRPVKKHAGISTTIGGLLPRLSVLYIPFCEVTPNMSKQI